MLAILVGALVLLFAIWAVRFGYAPQDRPQVLCYHKISNDFLWEGTWMTPRRFAEQLDDLQANGYEFIDEAQYLAAIDNPGAQNQNKLLLTFDDGYEVLHDVAREVLAPRNIPSLVFLVADYAGRDNTWDLGLGRKPAKHLSWEQVEDMKRYAVAFGSHGRSHRDLTKLRGEVIEEEVAGSKHTIEEKLGAPIRSFSYPFGRYNAAAQAAVKQAGYDAAFSLYPAHANEHIDMTALRRNGVYIIDTPSTIRMKLRPGMLYWFEEMKCRTINAVAALTPLLKRRA